MNPTVSLKNKTFRYMNAEVEDHFDARTGEVNYTALAEDAAAALDLYEGTEIPEWVFEKSLEVGEYYEGVRERERAPLVGDFDDGVDLESKLF